MPSGDFQPIINPETIIHVIQESEDFFRASFAKDYNPTFFSATGKTREEAIGKLIVSQGNRKSIYVSEFKL